MVRADREWLRRNSEWLVRTRSGQGVHEAGREDTELVGRTESV